MPDRYLDINEGTVSFRILSGRVDFAGNTHVLLWKGEPVGGELRITKDEEAQMEFVHLKYEEGRTATSCDVSFLDPTAAHRVEASWSLSEGKIELYLDGTCVCRMRIAYT